MRLEDLVLAGRRGGPGGLTVEEVAAGVRGLELADELVATHTRFSPDGYARNLILRTPTFELLVLCWLPGQETVPHDHGGNVGAVRVVRGTLGSRLFKAEDGKPAAIVADDRLMSGEVALAGRDDIHQLGNYTDEELVTIHVYSRPLSVIGTYSTTSPERGQTRLRYTVEEDLP
jgi:cysteine dioxygenase